MKLGREVGLRQFSHQTFMMADLQDLGLYPECRGNLLKCFYMVSISGFKKTTLASVCA